MDFYEFVDWVHGLLPLEGRQLRLAEAKRRIDAGSPAQPYLLRQRDELSAGAYFLRLAGDVATLGGARSLPGYESQAARLLTQAVNHEYAAGLSQVQAVVPDDDAATQGLLIQAGFRQLTRVAHIYRSGPGASELSTHAAGSNKATVQATWRKASCLAESRLAQLVVQTFEQTLDCPELNGLRSPRQVLAGFLECQPLRQQNHWFVLDVQGQRAGCLFLTSQPASRVLELSYLGLVPEFRGRGLGQELLRRALAETHHCGAELLAAAVDYRNLPALQIYEQFGFKSHVLLQVWLHQREA